MIFPGELWLEKIRFGVQSGFFAVFLLALGLSLGAVWKRRAPIWNRCNRAIWTFALVGFVGMWGAGASLEMMRRAAMVSGRGLLVALIAFSVLLAGVVSLAGEWFPAREAKGRKNEGGDENAISKPTPTALRGDRIAGSLLAFSLVGWWFGGFSGPQNALFAISPLTSNLFQNSQPKNQISETATGRAAISKSVSLANAASKNLIPKGANWADGWVLALAGAQLLGAAQMVHNGKRSRVLNARPATWWLLSFGLALAIPFVGAHPVGASVAFFGFGAFLLKIWGARPETREFSRATRRASWLLIPILAALPLVLGVDWAQWLARQNEFWRAPNLVAPLIFWVLAIGFLLGGRFPLRLAIFDRFSTRALLNGVLAGAFPATLFFGPNGALWWSFFPLAGVFYDLLASHEHPSFERAKSDVHAELSFDPDDAEPEFEPEIGVFAGSGRAQND